MRWFKLPAEGLWISPDGERLTASEHLLAIRDNPTLFGLPLAVQKMDIPDLEKVAEDLINKGWTRYRYLDGRHHFEVDDARARMSLIRDVLQSVNALADEELWVSQVGGQESQGKVKDAHDHAFLRFEGKIENKWRFSGRA